MIKRIFIVNFVDGHGVSEYDPSYSLEDVQRDIEANGYEWVTMHNISGNVYITIIEK